MDTFSTLLSASTRALVWMKEICGRVESGCLRCLASPRYNSQAHASWVFQSLYSHEIGLRERGRETAMGKPV